MRYNKDHQLNRDTEQKLPEWKVYYKGNFWGHHGRERAGKEMAIRKQFSWGEKNVYIPAVYACSKGLVVDYCVQIPREYIQAFMNKWNLTIENDGSDFSHPTTGVQHTLTVQEYQRQEMSTEHFGDKNYEYPSHYTVMNYTLTPHLPANNFTVTDCEENDRPQQKQIISNVSLSSTSCAAIAIIGGSNGPTAIVLGGAEQGNLGTACSALHFDPVDEVEWQMVFHEKTCEDITVKLL